MEEKLYQTTPSTTGGESVADASAVRPAEASIFRNPLVIIALIFFVVSIILAIVGWLVQNGYFNQRGLTDAERARMIAALGTSTPLTDKEKMQMKSSLGTTTALTEQEKQQMLQSLGN